MMDRLTEYEKDIFSKIESKLKVGKWYPIDPNREDYEKVISVIDKFHECYGLIEFYDKEKTKYKIVLRPNVVSDIINQNVGGFSETGDIINSKTYQRLPRQIIPEFKHVNRSENWSIPGYRSRPDIGDKILAKEAADNVSKKYISEKEKKRIEEVKKWKNNL